MIVRRRYDHGNLIKMGSILQKTIDKPIDSVYNNNRRGTDDGCFPYAVKKITALCESQAVIFFCYKKQTEWQIQAKRSEAGRSTL